MGRTGAYDASLAALLQAPNHCDGKDAGELTWHDAAALGLRGRAFNKTAETYQRLPSSAEKGAGPGGKGPVRSSIWDLQTQPAGLFVQFETAAACIFLRYKIKPGQIPDPRMGTMAAISMWCAGIMMLRQRSAALPLRVRFS
jgi:hypothetical protein